MCPGDESTLLAGERGEIDYAAPASLPHRRREYLAPEQHTPQVHGEHVVLLGSLALPEAASHHHAGVVDGGPDRPERSSGVVRRCREGVAVADVDLARKRRLPRWIESVRDRRGAIELQICECNPSARRVQRLGNRGAEPLGCSGDQSNPAREGMGALTLLIG